MSTGSNQVVLVVQLQGAAGGGPTAPPSPGPSPGPSPPPGPSPGPTSPGGGGGRSPAMPAWWRALLQLGGPNAQVLQQGMQTVQSINVLGRVTPALMRFGVALAAVTGALAVVRTAYRAHARAVDDLANRLAFGPAVEALQQIQDLRIEMARMRRGEEFIGRIAPALQRRTDTQIALEDFGAQLAEFRRQLLEGPMASVEGFLQVISNNGSNVLKQVNDSGWLEWFSKEVFRYWTEEALARGGVNPFDPGRTPTQEFRNLLAVFSPENPANIPFDDDGDNIFQATIADMFQVPEEAL